MQGNLNALWPRQPLSSTHAGGVSPAVAADLLKKSSRDMISLGLKGGLDTLAKVENHVIPQELTDYPSRFFQFKLWPIVSK